MQILYFSMISPLIEVLLFNYKIHLCMYYVLRKGQQIRI